MNLASASTLGDLLSHPIRASCAALALLSWHESCERVDHRRRPAALETRILRVLPVDKVLVSCG